MLKTILVPIGGLDADDTVLETAYRVAKIFDSHMDCLFVRPDPREMVARAAAVDLGAPVITPELWDTLESEDRDRVARAHRLFDAFHRQRHVTVSETPIEQGVSASWREGLGDPVRHIIPAARVDDCVVLGQASELGLSLGQIGEVLLACGRPVFLAPREAPKTVGTTIAIAWKGTAEAAHALTAAMPLLEKAEKVVIVSADDGDGIAATFDSADRLAHKLQWSGIHAALSPVPIGTRDVPEAILNAVSEAGADLMVMGGYSHSRARELIFGGFTRYVLNNAALPVLMCH